MGDMQAALLAAIPEAAERIPLSRQIVSAEQLQAVGDPELARLDAAHAAEIVSLVGRIEAATDPAWIRRARQALRVLHLHHRWVATERVSRKKQAAKREQSEARREADRIKQRNREIAEQNRRATAELQAQQHADRLARIRAANDLNIRDVGVFKDVAREVLGMEMYEHLWELTRQRLAAAATNGG